eukprot:UN08064
MDYEYIVYEYIYNQWMLHELHNNMQSNLEYHLIQKNLKV